MKQYEITFVGWMTSEEADRILDMFHDAICDGTAEGCRAEFASAIPEPNQTTTQPSEEESE